MVEDRHPGIPGGNGSGANVKSGIVAGLADNASEIVIFATAFASVPNVTLTLRIINGFGVDMPMLIAPSTTQFAVRVHKGHGGSGHTYDVHWIATDAGDP